MGKVILKIDLFLRRGEEEEGGKGEEREEEEEPITPSRAPLIDEM